MTEASEPRGSDKGTQREIRTMFSTVFQDVHYFAYSVGENVAESADMVPGEPTRCCAFLA